MRLGGERVVKDPLGHLPRHAQPRVCHADGRPAVVAGVPPDYFSATGQLWGNPLYNWEALREDDFSWWIKRLQHSLSMFHLVRIDHFRGLLAYWAVPFGDKTAEKGIWKDAPSEAFFASLRKSIPAASFLAENLGVITPDVTDAMERMNFPGMAVVLFAFGGGMKDNPHIPHNYSATLAAYSGTHDNNTALGWYRDDASLSAGGIAERFVELFVNGLAPRPSGVISGKSS